MVADALGDHDELITTEATDEIQGVAPCQQGIGDLTEHLVGVVVPERLFSLEPVKIHEQDREWLLGPRPQERSLEPLEDRRAVRQTRQAVVARVVDESLERSVALDRDPRELRTVLHQRQMLR